MVVIALAAILTGFAIFNYRDFLNHVADQSHILGASIGRIRSEATGTHFAYFVTTPTPDSIHIFRSNSCTLAFPGAGWAPAPELNLTLKEGVTIAAVEDITLGTTVAPAAWTGTCISPRGFVRDNVQFVLEKGGVQYEVETFLAGSTIVRMRP